MTKYCSGVEELQLVLYVEVKNCKSIGLLVKVQAVKLHLNFPLCYQTLYYRFLLLLMFMFNNLSIFVLYF
jgi:hypothetical protein